MRATADAKAARSSPYLNRWSSTGSGTNLSWQTYSDPAARTAPASQDAPEAAAAPAPAPVHSLPSQPTPAAFPSHPGAASTPATTTSRQHT